MTGEKEKMEKIKTLEAGEVPVSVKELLNIIHLDGECSRIWWEKHYGLNFNEGETPFVSNGKICLETLSIDKNFNVYKHNRAEISLEQFLKECNSWAKKVIQWEGRKQ